MNRVGQDRAREAQPIQGAIANQPDAGIPSIPDHQLLRLIASGAYGEVWLGLSTVGTPRAVKIVRRDQDATSESFEREFKGLQKFEPVSRSHEGLVDILTLGLLPDKTGFYYVMELADGISGPLIVPTNASGEAERTGPTPEQRKVELETYAPRTLRADLKLRGALPAEEVIELGLKLTAALAYLHAQGLVHRDLKPANIIFVRGQPKLADIGLVTDAAKDDDTRSIVGTEGYLAPEGPGTPQADLFALGKVLYEAATGFDRRQFPRLPPDLRVHPDARALMEVNEILLKACAHDSRKRYRSAAALLPDLKLLSTGGSLRHIDRVRRWGRLAGQVGLWGGAAAAAFAVLWIGGHRGGQPPVKSAERLSTNAVANRLYDRGRLYFEQTTGSGFEKSADYLEQAIQADTNFAQAYASLSLTYTWSIDGWSGNCWSNLPKAKATALRALDLDESLPEPHLALGMHKVMREWAWDDAEQEFQQAVAINHSKPVFHYFYAEFLRMRGRTNEALAEMTSAFNLDRLSACSNVRLADFLIAARRYEEALTQADQAIAMEPFAHSYGWLFRIRALAALNRYREAIDAEQEQRKRWGESAEKVDLDIRTLRRAAESDAPTAYWKDQLSRTDAEDFYWKARAYSQLSDHEKAIENLKHACDLRDVWLTFYVMTDWTLDPVRNDPRFHQILKVMRLE